MPLDLSKLSNVKSAPDGWTAQCPVCSKDGRDIHGKNHLKIWQSGQWSCVVAPGDKDHNREIWALAGDGSSSDFTETVSQPIQIEIERTWDASVLSRLIHDYTYWEGRGIRRETIECFQGGVATSGQMKGRFVFPVFNGEGKIIGFNGRTIREGTLPKWKILGKKSTFVWGGLDEIEETKIAVLVESFGDAFALKQNGVAQTLCMFGANLSEAVLAHLISANPDRIIVATNRDVKHEVGQMAAEKAARTLRLFFAAEKVQIALPLVAKDFGEESEEKLLEWKKMLDL